MRILRVFPRRTSHTPDDNLAFVGDPPLWLSSPETRPQVDEVHVSVAFTWDLEEAKRLAGAWGQYYCRVLIGGPACGDRPCGFVMGRYVKGGVTFTSRGCDNECPWCLVPEREGKLRMLHPFAVGHIIQDNNFLQCPESHRRRAYQMLGMLRTGAEFSGGLQASLVTDSVAEELRGLRIREVFLAADTDGALKPLRQAVKRLSFLPKRKLRCYVMIGYKGERLQTAEARLEEVWEAGAMPFAQLYQPPEFWIEYSPEYKALARKWSRPAAMWAVPTRQPNFPVLI